MNRAAISGNITRDAEARQTQSGMAIVNFSVAVNERKKNAQTGQWEDVPSFFDCVFFGSRAEKLMPYLVKGTKVVIDGKLRQSSWQDKQTGQKRSKVEIVVDDIDFVSPRQQQPVSRPQMPAPVQAPVQQPIAPQAAPQAVPQYPQQYVPQPTAQPVVQQPGLDMYSEDIPF
jgi:single-strand DNA-binding protein